MFEPCVNARAPIDAGCGPMWMRTSLKPVWKIDSIFVCSAAGIRFPLLAEMFAKWAGNCSAFPRREAGAH